MADNADCKNLLKKLDQLLKDVSVVKERAGKRDEEIDCYYSNVKEEVSKFRRVINGRLDELQALVLAEADTKQTIDKQIVQTVFGTCSSIVSDVTKLQTNLKNSKTSDSLGNSLQEAKLVLKSQTIKNTEELLEKTDKQYKFEANGELMEKLTEANIFGRLILQPLIAKPKKMRALENIELQAEISIRFKSDKVDCDIKGCAVLSPDILVMADWANKKVKLFNSERKKIIEEKELEALPSDVAKLPDDKIAVPLPGKRTLLFMSTNPVSIVQRIPIRGECTAVTYRDHFIYVMCRSPKCIYMLDRKGEAQKTIALDTDVFSELSNISISEDSQCIYVSEFEKNFVASVTPQGKITATFKQKDFIKPRGMLVLDDGSLLVACWNGTIYQLSWDLKQARKVIGGYKNLRSICYSAEQNVFYVGSWSGQLRILKA